MLVTKEVKAEGFAKFIGRLNGSALSVVMRVEEVGTDNVFPTLSLRIERLDNGEYKLLGQIFERLRDKGILTRDTYTFDALESLIKLGIGESINLWAPKEIVFEEYDFRELMLDVFCRSKSASIKFSAILNVTRDEYPSFIDCKDCK